MLEEGMEEVYTYILHRQNTITQYNVTRPILELCLEAEQQLGAWVTHRWWEHVGLDLEGVMVATREAESKAEEQTEEEEEGDKIRE